MVRDREGEGEDWERNREGGRDECNWKVDERHVGRKECGWKLQGKKKAWDGEGGSG